MVGASEADFLRVELKQLRAQAAGLARAVQESRMQHTIITQILCGVLYKLAEGPVRLTPDDVDACREFCGFRVRVEWEVDDNGDRTSVLTLPKLTKEELEKMHAQLAKETEAAGTVIVPPSTSPEESSSPD